jgi:hypothetical protein
MPTNVQEVKNEYIGDIALYLFRFILGYISFILFAPMAGLSLFVLWLALMGLIFRFGDYSVILLEGIMRFINASDVNFVKNFGIDGILKIYFLLSLIFTIIIEIIKFILKKYFKKEFKFSFKRRVIIILVLIHVIYVAALISIIFSGFMKEGGISLLLIIFIFYIFNMLMLGGYFLIQGVCCLFDNYLQRR